MFDIMNLSTNKNFVSVLRGFIDSLNIIDVGSVINIANYNTDDDIDSIGVYVDVRLPDGKEMRHIELITFGINGAAIVSMPSTGDRVLLVGLQTPVSSVYNMNYSMDKGYLPSSVKAIPITSIANVQTSLAIGNGIAINDAILKSSLGVDGSGSIFLSNPHINFKVDVDGFVSFQADNRILHYLDTDYTDTFYINTDDSLHTKVITKTIDGTIEEKFLETSEATVEQADKTYKTIVLTNPDGSYTITRYDDDGNDMFINVFAIDGSETITRKDSSGNILFTMIVDADGAVDTTYKDTSGNDVYRDTLTIDGKEVMVRSNGGTAVATTTIDPDGTITHDIANKNIILIDGSNGNVTIGDGSRQKDITFNCSKLKVTGDVEFDKTLKVTGDVTFSSNLTVSGDTTTTGNISQQGDTTISGNLTVTGSLSAASGRLTAN